jgi:hypothetical protein
MAAWNWKRLRWIFLVVLVLFSLWLLFGISIRTDKPIRERLAEARTTWNSKGITSYGMTGRVFVPLLIAAPFSVTVKQGRVTDINVPEDPRGGGLKNLSFILPPETDQFTVEQMLDFAASKVANQPDPPLISICGLGIEPSRYEVTLNQQFGYLESLSLTNCVRWDFGGGLLCGFVTDCASSFGINHFEPLPN